MASLFKELKEDAQPYNEWSGAFSCMESGCHGAASIARHYPNERLLIWECDAGHKSKLEGIDE